MPQIFHPSMNTISRVSIFGAVFMLCAVLLIVGLVVRSPYVTEAGVIRSQPIPFSHQHHVAEAGIDCRYCHQSVETDAYAGMPSTEVCMDCHSQLWADSEMLAPVRESFRSGKPLAWTRVHDMPDFVYFNHAIHINKGVGCETCHGRVDRMPLMWREHTLHMEWCLECHRHPEKFLRPEDAVFTLGWQPSADSPSGEELLRAFSLNSMESKTNCWTCHR